MMKLVGPAALTLLSAAPALASAQPFPTCTDAQNFGWNTAQVMVGQVFARLQCDPAGLGESEQAITKAMRNLTATWTGSAEQKTCYYKGLYSSTVSRLEVEYAQCPPEPPFKVVSPATVARVAMATFAAMIPTEPSVLDLDSVHSVFDIDYSFLGVIDPGRCSRAMASARQELLAPSLARRYASLTSAIDAQICGAPR